MWRFQLIVLLLMSSLCYGQTDIIDSLKLELGKDLPDSTRIKHLRDIGQNLWYIDANQSIEYSEQSVQLARANSGGVQLARSLRVLGVGYYFISSLDSSVLYLNEALAISEDLKDTLGMSAVYNNLGLVTYRRGDYETALEYYQQGEQLVPKNEISRIGASISQNMSVVLSELGYAEEALKYLKKSIIQVGDSFLGIKMRSYSNLGIAFSQMKEYDSAKYYLQKSLELALELNSSTTIANNYQALGSMHLEQNKLEEAKSYYENALGYNLENGNRFALSYNYQGLAAYYDRKGQQPDGQRGDFLKSLEYARKLVDISKEIEAPERLMMGYQKMYDGYEMIGDLERSLEYLKLHTQLKDSIFNERKTRQLSEMKEKYDAEERDKEIALQTIEIERQQSELSQQAILRNALIGGLMAVLAIAGLIYRNERLKTKKNNQIESLLREIHHRVKNNLQVISSLLNMQARSVDDEEVLETIKEGQSRVKAMSLIHQKLYQTESISEIDLQEYITELAMQLKELYIGADSNINTDISAQNVSLDLDTAIPLGLILNELISNAYKYAFEESKYGSIKIDLKRLDGDQLQLEVSDDGKGLPNNLNLDKVKSLGLKLVNILTKQLKGTLSYTGVNGSKFTINFKDLRMVG